MVFTEKKLVEDYIIEKLQAKDWRFVVAEELERDSYQEPLLVPNLNRAIARINKPLGISDEEVNKLLNELKLTPTGIEGAKRILNFYKFGVPIKFEKEKVIKYVQLFDCKNIDNNEFIVTRQVNYDGRDRIRTDIVLYINGIPLVNIECKNPASISESWYNAYVQIKDYEQTVPELYKYVQLGVAVGSVARYFPIVPWQEEVKTYEWREKNEVSIDSTVEMFSKERLLDILKNFLFFRFEFGNATKVVTRYMQYHAANKIVNRVTGNLKGEEDKDKGLIWHWQGSGKTLTMIFAANKLYYETMLENPTVFFIVDRIELEEQLYTEFYSLDIVEPEVIGSTRELKDVLNYDDYRGKRGVFIVLIHKFRPEELEELQKELEEVSKKKETITNRKNVIAFIDEGHRTQYGPLAAQMKAVLKSAFFFALTGTPISKKGRDTYLEFSYPPEEQYLDRYFITDSIRDGFTVKIVYQPRLEKEVHLRKDLLEAFIEVEFEEIPEDYRDKVKEKVKDRLNAIELVLENPERINLIAKDIAQHFKENVDGKFKAMIVAASRTACVLYEKALEKHLPREYFEVVMTMYERGEKPVVQEYVAETKARYKAKDLSDVRKTAISGFKEEEFPKILIVTDMLLTGFDAPILQTIYLDKPLKEHRLLQAIARTNRPFKGVKEAGVIIDYVGILKEFKKALEMYSEADISGALYDYDSLKTEFVLLIKEILEIFEAIPKDYERETLLKAVEVITTDEQKEKEFVEKYRHMRKVFELLGPAEVKLEYFEDYKWLSAIYVYYIKVVVRKPTYSFYAQKYYDKTVRFIHKSIEVEKVEKELPVIAFDEEYLKNLEEKVKNKKEKAANILFTLNRLVLVERHKSPIYESLVDRVERLLEIWKEKTRDYAQIYTEGVKTVKDANALLNRQRSLGFSNLEYSMLLTLEKSLGKREEINLVEEVKSLSQKLDEHMFPGWINQITAKKEVEREIRRFARGLKSSYGLSFDEMDELYNKLMESIRNYGAV